MVFCADSCFLLVVFCLWFVVNWLSLVACWSLCTLRNLLFVVGCVLFSVVVSCMVSGVPCLLSVVWSSSSLNLRLRVCLSVACVFVVCCVLVVVCWLLCVVRCSLFLAGVVLCGVRCVLSHARCCLLFVACFCVCCLVFVAVRLIVICCPLFSLFVGLFELFFLGGGGVCCVGCGVLIVGCWLWVVVCGLLFVVRWLLRAAVCGLLFGVCDSLAVVVSC